MSELIRAGAFSVDGAGLVITGEPGRDEWREFGTKLGALSRSVMWAVGDWLNYGEAKWGEMYTEAADITGLEVATLRDAKWVAGRFELSGRPDNLTFEHHRRVVSLPPAQADAILARASQEELSTREVRALVREAKAVAKEPDPFLPHVEGAEVERWLRDRRGTWPAELRDTFAALLRRIAEDMEHGD